jgi:pyruvate,water dikinase
VVGCGDATKLIKNSANYSILLKGRMALTEQVKMGSNRAGFSQLSMPDTDPMFILADPDRCF